MAEIGNLLGLGVLAVDASLIVTGWNEWLERATGKSRVDVLGRPLREVEPTLRPAAVAAFDRAIQGSVVVMSQALHEYLLEAPAPGGFEHLGRMRQSVRILPLRGDGSQSLGATAFIEDVTERVAREADLRAAAEAAQRADEAKSKFFTSMSHELRTPIGAIAGYADLLASGMFGSVTETQSERLTRIKTVASHLQHIVDDVLSFARIGAGREEAEVTDGDALALAREALIAVEPLAVKKGLAVRSRLPADRVPIRTDQVKVRQILINLLGNAIKFTERGSIEIEVSLVDEGRTVAFSVLDTGPGISQANLAGIFDPFTRVPNRDRPKPGTGLGLAVSRGLARLLGGDISVTSEVGVGSRFTARIPR
jgi:signal transduction histidine kinase